MPRIQMRRATTAEWSAANPVLASGEPGYDKSAKRMKIGDGVTPWNDLDFFVPFNPDDSNSTLPDHVNSETPHPIYDDGPSLYLLYQNAKV